MVPQLQLLKETPVNVIHQPRLQIAIATYCTKSLLALYKSRLIFYLTDEGAQIFSSWKHGQYFGVL